MSIAFFYVIIPKTSLILFIVEMCHFCTTKSVAMQSECKV